MLTKTPLEARHQIFSPIRAGARLAPSPAGCGTGQRRRQNRMFPIQDVVCKHLTTPDAIQARPHHHSLLFPLCPLLVLPAGPAAAVPSSAGLLVPSCTSCTRITGRSHCSARRLPADNSRTTRRPAKSSQLVGCSSAGFHADGIWFCRHCQSSGKSRYPANGPSAPPPRYRRQPEYRQPVPRRAGIRVPGRVPRRHLVPLLSGARLSRRLFVSGTLLARAREQSWDFPAASSGGSLRAGGLLRGKVASRPRPTALSDGSCPWHPLTRTKAPRRPRIAHGPRPDHPSS